MADLLAGFEDKFTPKPARDLAAGGTATGIRAATPADIARDRMQHPVEPEGFDAVVQGAKRFWDRTLKPAAEYVGATLAAGNGPIGPGGLPPYQGAQAQASMALARKTMVDPAHVEAAKKVGTAGVVLGTAAVAEALTGGALTPVFAALGLGDLAKMSMESPEGGVISAVKKDPWGAGTRAGLDALMLLGAGGKMMSRAPLPDLGVITPGGPPLPRMQPTLDELIADAAKFGSDRAGTPGYMTRTGDRFGTGMRPPTSVGEQFTNPTEQAAQQVAAMLGNAQRATAAPDSPFSLPADFAEGAFEPRPLPTETPQTWAGSFRGRLPEEMPPAGPAARAAAVAGQVQPQAQGQGTTFGPETAARYPGPTIAPMPEAPKFEMGQDWKQKLDAVASGGEAAAQTPAPAPVAPVSPEGAAAPAVSQATTAAPQGEPATPPAAPEAEKAPAPTPQKPAQPAPAFKTGDDVEWTDQHGTEWRGTVRGDAEEGNTEVVGHPTTGPDIATSGYVRAIKSVPTHQLRPHVPGAQQQPEPAQAPASAPAPAPRPEPAPEPAAKATTPGFEEYVSKFLEPKKIQYARRYERWVREGRQGEYPGSVGLLPDKTGAKIRKEIDALAGAAAPAPAPAPAPGAPPQGAPAEAPTFPRGQWVRFQPGHQHAGALGKVVKPTEAGRHEVEIWKDGKPTGNIVSAGQGYIQPVAIVDAIHSPEAHPVPFRAGQRVRFNDKAKKETRGTVAMVESIGDDGLVSVMHADGTRSKVHPRYLEPGPESQSGRFEMGDRVRVGQGHAVPEYRGQAGTVREAHHIRMAPIVGNVGASDVTSTYRVQLDNGQVAYTNAANTEAETGGTVDTTMSTPAAPEGTETPAKPAVKPALDLSQNTAFAADDVEERIKRIKAALSGRANLGLDPSVMVDAVFVAGAYIEAGARTWAQYTAQMAETFGDAIEPYLRQLYEMVRYDPRTTPEMRDAMTPTADVDSAQQTAQADEETAAPATAEAVRADQQLAVGVAGQLAKREPLTEAMFWNLADRAYGGTRAEGAYGPSEAYDAMETGLNLALRGKTDPGAAPSTSRVYKDMGFIDGKLDLLPKQKNRSGEKDALQQFSTPPNYAYALVWAANLTGNDVFLEPSAGTGDIAIHAYNALPTPNVHVNELSPRRAALLADLGFTNITTENAEHIHNILDVKPTVVVMNPPFSHDPNRPGVTDTRTGIAHVEAALKMLAPNGRLIAVLGGVDRVTGRPTKTYLDWLGTLAKTYTVRARITVQREIYAKYGTTFPTQVVIIDKVGPNTVPMRDTGVTDTNELIRVLGEVRNERVPAGERKPAESGEQVADVEGERGPAPGVRVQPATSGVGSGGGRKPADTERVPRKPARPNPADANVEAGERHPAPAATGTDRGRPGAPDTGDDAEGRGEPAGGQSLLQPQRTAAGAPAARSGTEGLTSEEEDAAPAAVFETYRPSVTFAGAKPHPAAVVESAAMGAIEAVAPTYAPDIPKNIVESGALSDVQLEAIAFAGQAHEAMLPAVDANDPDVRQAFMIGDGTGIGKGREIAGIILDNFRHGRRKAVWITEKQKLYEDAQRDWQAIGGKADSLFNVSRTKGSDNLAPKAGIAFTTYDTLKSSSKPDNAKGIAARSRVDQLVAWLGKDFDGVIAFDEAHNMANAIATKGSRGRQKASARAEAGIRLQHLLPKARVVYVTATAATEVSNFAYMARLGLWGRNTAFANVVEFINSVASGGVAAMELVARDMKAMGLYLARSIAFQNPANEDLNVTYRRIEHTLPEHQRDAYNRICDAWQVILRNFDKALEITAMSHDGKIDSKAKNNARSALWSTHQRFMNQVITGLQTPAIISDIEKQLAEGKSVVIQLVNTNEAEQERALAKQNARAAREEDDEDYEDDDFAVSALDSLMQLVEHCFPVNTYVETVDPVTGKASMVLATDSNGNPIKDREAVAMRDKLLDDLARLRDVIPPNPLDFIIEHFGADKVAEITGRKRRIINGKEDRRGSRANSAESAAFQSGKKRILIFSDAGGTGASYHADLMAGNQQKRIHYLLQAGWRAAKALQGLGRTHRSNERWAPEYVLVTTDLKGQKRFISSIARRLHQLGALTRGQRDTASTGIFSAADNLESTEAQDALTEFWRELYGNRLPGITLDEFERQTGLELTDTNGNLKRELPDVTRFLNRLLTFRVDEQNAVFDAFEEILERTVQRALENGTLDQGMEHYRAEGITKNSERVVHTDPRTGAQTKYVRLTARHRVRTIPWSRVVKETDYLVRVERTGSIYAVRDAPAKMDPHTGEMIPHVRLINVTGHSHVEPKAKIEGTGRYDPNTYERLEGAAAREAWESALAATPEHDTEVVHLISGAILPVWNLLRGRARVVSLTTDEGDRFLGRVVPEDDIKDVLRNLGATEDAPDLTPEEAYQVVHSGQGVLVLNNGWRIRRSRVAGEQRIEIGDEAVYGSTPSTLYERELASDGVTMERVAYSWRYFIPTGPNGPHVLKRVVESRPIARVDYTRNRKIDPSQMGFAIIPDVGPILESTMEIFRKVLTPVQRFMDADTANIPFVRKGARLVAATVGARSINPDRIRAKAWANAEHMIRREKYRSMVMLPWMRREMSIARMGQEDLDGYRVGKKKTDGYRDIKDAAIKEKTGRRLMTVGKTSAFAGRTAHEAEEEFDRYIVRAFHEAKAAFDEAAGDDLESADPNVRRAALSDGRRAAGEARLAVFDEAEAAGWNRQMVERAFRKIQAGQDRNLQLGIDTGVWDEALIDKWWGMHIRLSFDRYEDQDELVEEALRAGNADEAAKLILGGRGATGPSTGAINAARRERKSDLRAIIDSDYEGVVMDVEYLHRLGTRLTASAVATKEAVDQVLATFAVSEKTAEKRNQRAAHFIVYKRWGDTEARRVGAGVYPNRQRRWIPDDVAGWLAQQFDPASADFFTRLAHNYRSAKGLGKTVYEAAMRGWMLALMPLAFGSHLTQIIGNMPMLTLHTGMSPLEVGGAFLLGAQHAFTRSQLYRDAHEYMPSLAYNTADDALLGGVILGRFDEKHAIRQLGALAYRKMSDAYGLWDRLYRIGLFAVRMKAGDTPDAAGRYVEAEMLNPRMDVPPVVQALATTKVTPIVKFLYMAMARGAEKTLHHPQRHAWWMAMWLVVNANSGIPADERAKIMEPMSPLERATSLFIGGRDGAGRPIVLSTMKYWTILPNNDVSGEDPAAQIVRAAALTVNPLFTGAYEFATNTPLWGYPGQQITKNPDRSMMGGANREKAAYIAQKWLPPYGPAGRVASTVRRAEGHRGMEGKPIDVQLEAFRAVTGIPVRGVSASSASIAGSLSLVRDINEWKDYYRGLALKRARYRAGTPEYEKLTRQMDEAVKWVGERARRGTHD